jgi:hypothetical protein
MLIHPNLELYLQKQNAKELGNLFGKRMPLVESSGQGHKVHSNMNLTEL